MKAYLAVTDNDWFRFLGARPHLDEVNFWQPSGGRTFRALSPGQPLLFKLHHPENYVVGGGFFAHFSKLPVTLAWEAFGEKNGASSYSQMRARIEHYLKIAPNPKEDYVIGCIILEEPFFLARHRWIAAPADFSKNIVQGKTYDLREAIGNDLWQRILGERAVQRHTAAERVEGPVYGGEALTKLRLGQGTFRILVTDAYHRRCAVTGERALPVLQAAHIRPLSEGGVHQLDNGLLLRSDVHTLFDRGYVTVAPDFRFRASRRLKRDFDNGEFYFGLNGEPIALPDEERNRPAQDVLEWHADTVFLG